MATNTEAASIKARRTTAATKPTAPDPTGNVTGATQAPGIGVGEPPRNYFMLGDPDEPRAVIEASGGPYGPILGTDYVRAPEDAVENFAPKGCVTEVSRQLWCTGQHVPIEVFYKHYGKERADALIAAAENARQPAPTAAAPAPEKTGSTEVKQPENPPA